MNKFLIPAVFLTILVFAPHLHAETEYDPMKRNLLHVEGNAELTVPINAFDMSFGFDVDKASFDEANQHSARIVERIEANMKDLNLPSIQVLRGWDLVRQARISLGAKGRKVSNRVTIRVVNFPEGKLHELISKIIDRSLAADAEVALEGVRVYVSEEVENRKRGEVLTAALKALQANAARGAEALGRKLGDPKQVYVNNQPGRSIRNRRPEGAAMYEMAQASMVSVQKSFNVQAEISDHVKIHARVSGVYQLE